MDLDSSLQIVRDVLAVVALMVGAIFAVLVYEQFAPVVCLRIVPTWCDETKQLLKLRFEVENSSRVRAYVESIVVQVLEHTPDGRAVWSGWVPFTLAAVRPEERPIEWREGERIFSSTLVIRTGETVAVERLYGYSQASLIIHAGLQVRLRAGFLGRLSGARRARFQQTATCYVVK